MIRVSDLQIEFGSASAPVRAVRGVSFEVRPGEIVALVGESGSGKSATSAAIAGILPGSARATGSISIDDTEMVGLQQRRLPDVRGRRISMVFQEPISSLNPVNRIGEQVAEALRELRGLGRSAAAAEAVALLDRVGIRDPEGCARKYPHELSGGMCQRVMIAIAVAGQAPYLIADEPTTALDVTVQARILDLFRDLVAERELGILLITHDLGVVADIADRVLVMRQGEIVERNDVFSIFSAPEHPYTRQLLAASMSPLTGRNALPEGLTATEAGA